MNPLSLQQTNRIWFLQFSRAIACLMIVSVHWLGFVSQPNAVIKLIKQGPLAAYPHMNLGINLHGILPPSFNEAFISLAIFFLISGYVIPMTMENTPPLQFLIRRIIRVFPTLIICLSVTILLVRLGRHLDHLSMHRVFKHKRIWTNFLLLRDVYHESFIENATWTLEIEVHFYFMCFLLAFFDGYKKASLILISVLSLLCAENWQVFLVHRDAMTQYLGLNVSYICLMFVGTCLYNWNKKNWSGKKTMWMVLALLVINYMALFGNPTWAQNASTTYCNDIYSLLIFVILLLVNDRLPYHYFLDRVAQASYPLYLVHGFTGYVIYFIAFKLTHHFPIALAIAIISVIALTTVIHKLIEVPSIKFSKRIFAAKKRSNVMIPVTEKA